MQDKLTQWDSIASDLTQLKTLLIYRKISWLVSLNTNQLWELNKPTSSLFIKVQTEQQCGLKMQKRNGIKASLNLKQKYLMLSYTPLSNLTLKIKKNRLFCKANWNSKTLMYLWTTLELELQPIWITTEVLRKTFNIINMVTKWLPEKCKTFSIFTQVWERTVFP